MYIYVYIYTFDILSSQFLLLHILQEPNKSIAIRYIRDVCMKMHNNAHWLANLSTLFWPNILLPTHLVPKYFKGRVTLIFANNYLAEYRITMEFLRNFF